MSKRRGGKRETVNQHDLYSDHETARPAAAIEMLSARQAALEILEDVLGRRNALDHVLDQHPGFKALPGRDKAFTRMLVATTLRRLGQIDDLIFKAEDKPGPKNPVIQNILRLGTAQIMFMDVPDHAAVDTAVRLVDAAELDRQKGFVNAVLRTITRTGREWISRQDETRLNTPEWLLRLWIDDYGLRGAADIARANLAEAAMDITIRDESERNFWASQFRATELGVGSLRRTEGGGSVTDLPGFHEGKWWVQDASAAIPAHLFGDIRGRAVLDMCAAPGGKTMQLAAMGAHVTALDRSAKRLQRLEDNLQRMHLADKVEIVVADGSVWRPKTAPDLILLDAPCTATGTIRRHPDVPHLKTARDFESLVTAQAQLLDNAFDILAPGGILVFCTCSLQKGEGEYQIRRLLEDRADAMKIALTAQEIGGLEDAITEEGDVRILPYHQAARGGMDGFFISRITKIA